MTRSARASAPGRVSRTKAGHRDCAEAIRATAVFSMGPPMHFRFSIFQRKL